MVTLTIERKIRRAREMKQVEAGEGRGSLNDDIPSKYLSMWFTCNMEHELIVFPNQS